MAKLKTHSGSKRDLRLPVSVKKEDMDIKIIFIQRKHQKKEKAP